MRHRTLRILIIACASACGCLAARPAAAQLLGHWPLAGNLEDAEGAHDGVFFGGDAPVFIAGPDGTPRGAVLLDGADDFIEIPDEASEIILSSQLTLALWYRPISTGCERLTV